MTITLKSVWRCKHTKMHVIVQNLASLRTNIVSRALIGSGFSEGMAMVVYTYDKSSVENHVCSAEDFREHFTFRPPDTFHNPGHELF